MTWSFHQRTQSSICDMSCPTTNVDVLIEVLHEVLCWLLGFMSPRPNQNACRLLRPVFVIDSNHTFFKHWLELGNRVEKWPECHHLQCWKWKSWADELEDVLLDFGCSVLVHFCALSIFGLVSPACPVYTAGSKVEHGNLLALIDLTRARRPPAGSQLETSQPAREARGQKCKRNASVFFWMSLSSK